MLKEEVIIKPLKYIPVQEVPYLTAAIILPGFTLTDPQLSPLWIKKIIKRERYLFYALNQDKENK